MVESLLGYHICDQVLSLTCCDQCDQLPVGVPLEVEAGQEVHRRHGVQEAAVRLHCHHVAVIEVLEGGITYMTSAL